MYLSKTIENLVSEFMKLPGVGRKTAFRYTLYCLKNEVEYTSKLTYAISELRDKVKICTICFSPNDDEVCAICNNKARKENQICIVESYKDLVAIETTNQFTGKYHVLGGVISPIDGIGVENLTIESLVQRIKTMENVELIMALNPTIEGDTTVYYISKLLEESNVVITTISRGISFGGELDYTDELTLGRSLHARQPYESLINK